MRPLGLVFTTFLVAACGSSSSSGFEDGSGGSAATGEPPLVGAGASGGTTPNGQGVSRNSACATGTAAAQRGVSFLAFQFDRSGSMGDVGDPNSNISVCKGVLHDFFGDPASSGFSASLNLFPQRNSTDDLLCADTDYSSPVPSGAMQPLPSTGLATAASQITTVHGTPTLPALKGAHALATTVSSANNGAKVAVVLVTDGEPNECSSDVGNVAAFAKQARATAPTYVIGIGKSLTNLNQIAQDGSGRDAFLIDTSNPALVKTQFRDALTQVRALSATCDLGLPAPPQGQALDIQKVNVLITLNGAESSPTYDAACGGDGGDGWHYDNPQTPTKVTLCPSTCQKVQADPSAKVDVLFGCTTAGGVH